MTQPEPLSWIIDCSDLPEHGRSIRLDPPLEQQARLAQYAGVMAITALRAEAQVRPWAGGAEVHARLVADVVQACVVSLEPVTQHIDVPFTRRFLPPARLANDTVREAAIEIDPEAEDPPEPLTGDTIDLGPAIAEELILALDPYPRAPGAVAPASAGVPAEGSAFAILKTLKDPK